MNHDPRPWCAICRRAVDNFYVYTYPEAESGHGATVYIASCHGQQQQVTIKNSDLMEMVPGSMQLCAAFMNNNTKQPWGQT